MEYGRVYSERKKIHKKPMERIYVMLFFVCMVLFVITVSNNVVTEKNKNILIPFFVHNNIFFYELK